MFLPGGLSEVVPPVPIPNTVVKRFSTDDTEGVTPCGKYATARGTIQAFFFFTKIRIIVEITKPHIVL
jgi:hypothetical protein